MDVRRLGCRRERSSFGDTGSAVKFQSGPKAKPGNGAGLVNAAAKSPALSLCVAPATPVDDEPEFGWAS